MLLLQLEIRGIKLGVVVGSVGDSGRRVEADRQEVLGRHGRRRRLRELAADQFDVDTHVGRRRSRHYGTLCHVPGRLRQGRYLPRLVFVTAKAVSGFNGKKTTFDKLKIDPLCKE